ncbi:MAG: hypothetical protein LBC68_03720 [Prevotellaceae bacterium]|jgi:hypothetical protein|nr:hypothetical protein [Prevotellaceae bacterium]
MKKFIYFGLIALFALTVCDKKNEVLDATQSKQKANKNQTSKIVEVDLERPYKEMVLGEKIKNPFSVENMKKGKELMYQYLKDLEEFGITKQYLDNFQIKTTDLYVRFLPKNVNELDNLEADTNLILFPHPLHRKIIEDGDYYIDEDLPKDSNLIWYYAVVPYNYQMERGVQYEIIEPLFLPEHSSQLPLYQEWLAIRPQTDMSNAVDASSFWDMHTPLEKDFRNALTNAAARAAGYETEYKNNFHSQYEENCERKCFIWCWTDCDHLIYPQGRVLIETPTGTSGLSGVQVRIWRWYRADYVYTDGAGYFYDPNAWSGEAWADDMQRIQI